MRQLTSKVLLTVGIVLGSFSMAADDTHELLISEPATFGNVGGGTSAGSKFLNGFTFNINGGYNYKLNDMIQLGGRVMLGYTTAFQWGVALGPTFNFGDADLKNAWFFQILASLLGSSTPMSFQIDGHIGKRFKLSESVSWRPNVFASYSTSSSTFNLGVELVGFGFHW